MKNCNDRDTVELTRAQYDHLPSPLHKLTVDILVGRGECIVRGEGIAGQKQTDPPRKLP